jgi:hypothetical protein
MILANIEGDRLGVTALNYYLSLNQPHYFADALEIHTMTRIQTHRLCRLLPGKLYS